MTQPAAWPALSEATHARVPRVPFLIDDGGALRPAGSVAQAHLPALAAWPQALRVSERGVVLQVPAAGRNAFFAEANAALHAQGLIVAWRNETYPVLALPANGEASGPCPPAFALGTARRAHGRSPDPQLDLLATFERAASRFWGTATFGAHCNGYVADEAGRPTHLWIARRSDTKPTDPGLLDNLVGGGVPHGQSPADTVIREGWEEAGLTPAQMAGIRPGRILRLARDIPEGFQLEWLSVYDLALPPGLTPRNQDGEVQALHCWPVDEALARAAAGEMTIDATLATLDFALRHGLLTGPDWAADATRCATLLDTLAHGPALLAR